MKKAEVATDDTVSILTRVYLFLIHILIAHLTMVTAMTSVSTGIVTTAIPTMATDLSIPTQTQYWPLSVYGLTSAACLLAAGAIADVIRSKRVFLVGNFFLATFILASGLAQTYIQLIMFRAMQGIAVAACLPSSVGILTNAIASGRRRNFGFACIGLAQPLGFSLGAVLGGVFIDTVGWRVGWYLVAGVLFMLVPIGVYLLPADSLDQPPSIHALRTRVDWIGASITSAALAMLSFVLVQLSISSSMIGKPVVIVLLTIGLLLLPTFAWWMNFAARRGWPTLIPYYLWKRLPFTSICIMVMLSYGVMQTMELFCSLFFQHVQGFGPLQTSLRLLPSMLVGAILNLTTGLLIHKISPVYLVFFSSAICAGAPILMAIIHKDWPYWYAAFPAQILEPVS
jgi:MFS family permease